MNLYTIGHSNHSREHFISLLARHNINVLADVRSHPYSKYLPHFSRTELKKALLEAGIKYVFLGEQLGAKPTNRDCYIDARACYNKIANTQEFREGIQRVIKGAKSYKIALMCAEKDPINCHRAILVCQHLREVDLTILHILKDGEIETHQQLEERLLKLHKINSYPQVAPIKQLSLFEDNSFPNTGEKETLTESIKEAYQIQGKKIAYKEKNNEPDS